MPKAGWFPPRITKLFLLSGPGQITGVGNGNPSSHEPDKASQRKAFNGLCMALVRAGEKPGNIALTVKSKGLKEAKIKLNTVDI